MNRVGAALIALYIVAAAVGGCMLAAASDDGADLTVACGTKNCYEPVWIAERYGLFDREGVSVDMMYVDGGGSAATALMAGRADLTIVGPDPALRMFAGGAGKAVATIEVSSGGGSTDFVALESWHVDLSDPAGTLLNPDGSVRVRTGMDVTTGYRSEYLAYLKSAADGGKLTQEQCALLGSVRTGSSDGGIVDLRFEEQLPALLSGTVQMLCSGTTASMAAGMDGVEAVRPPPGTAVGCCVVVASEDAVGEKREAVVRALRALDAACEMIRSDETRLEAAEYCAGFYGSATWTVEDQLAFFDANYWDVCQLLNLEGFLESRAELLPDVGPSCAAGRVDSSLLVEVHRGDPSFVYDPETGRLAPGARDS